MVMTGIQVNLVGAEMLVVVEEEVCQVQVLLLMVKLLLNQVVH
tara:strand:- start:512 stop:640 length:129 start_codon:yes stop_codon:yes gene_type:complete